MAATSNTDGMEKVFEHCEITWRIENYYLATFGENWNINSPVIYVREPRTKWRMSVTPAPDYKNAMSFQLQRLEYDPGPDSVWAAWRMTIIAKKGDKEKEYHKMTGKNYFRNYEYQNKHLSRDSIEKHMVPPFEDKDSFCIKFHLIVRDGSKPLGSKLTEFKSDYGMTILKEFIRKRAGRKKYDIEIKNKSNKIKAHREVLSSGSRYFETHIERGTTFITLDLDRVDFSKIIAYLYSKDENYVLFEPNVDLYDIVKKLKIKKLQLHYLPSPCLVQLNTAQDVQYDEFRWVIENVSSKTNGTTITSPILYDGSFKTSWKLKLEIKVVKTVMRMSIFAEPQIEDTSNVEESRILAFVDIIPMTSEGSYIAKRSRNTGILDWKKVLESENFFEMKKSQIESSLPKNTLKIFFRIQMLLSRRVSDRKIQKITLFSKEEN